MKYFCLLTLLLCLNANSETITAEFPCEKTSVILKTLVSTYKEQPYLFGLADDVVNSKMSLWVNPKTKSWTILATKDDITCVIGTGKNFTLLGVST